MSVPIKQLKEHSDSSNFYPVTHVDAVVGLDAKITLNTVTVVDIAEENNRNPISSHGVHTIVGNIQILLETI